jgi:hypothetical protein
MVDIADIQKDLPGWPEDVIDQWLLYFANEPDCGWPPPDPLGSHWWNALLAGRPLSWWREVTWKSEKAKCDLTSLTPKARTGVNEILAEMITGTADATTKRRMQHPYRYIMDEGTFSRQLITMKTPAGLSLIDGSHRMAAFEMLQRTPVARKMEGCARTGRLARHA